MTKTIYIMTLLIVSNDLIGKSFANMERFSNYMAVFLISALLGIIVNVVLFKITDKGEQG